MGLISISPSPHDHAGQSVPKLMYGVLIALIPAFLVSCYVFGIGALIITLTAMASCFLFEFLIRKYLMQEKPGVMDGSALITGALLAFCLPSNLPVWLVILGSLVAIGVGKMSFGGIGNNPFNPALVAVAMLMLSWKDFFDFEQALLNYDLGFTMVYPLSAVKHFGTSAVASFSISALLLGQQIGGIGATFGLALIIGGLYLIARGFIRWEISLSFLFGILITAQIFNIFDPARFAGPAFHLLTGYTLISAFFLAPEDSSSPVNFIPMLIYGAGAGVLTVLIRNIGIFSDGIVFAILIMNILNPLLDKIRPQAIGKVG